MITVTKILDKQKKYQRTRCADLEVIQEWQTYFINVWRSYLYIYVFVLKLIKIAERTRDSLPIALKYREIASNSFASDDAQLPEKLLHQIN